MTKKFFATAFSNYNGPLFSSRNFISGAPAEAVFRKRKHLLRERIFDHIKKILILEKSIFIPILDGV